jgi:S1-C subfamily serine protease
VAELGRGAGLEVTEVVGGGPAQLAALRAEDLIVALDDAPVTGVADLQRMMTASVIDVDVTLTVIRAGQRRLVTVRPRELPTT